MSRVIKYLKQFNRKERFVLLTHVLGRGPQADDVFLLNADFAEKLGDKLELAIPHNAFVAMDYHLDWLQMALFLGHKDPSIESEVLYNCNPRIFEANQRDIDLIIAFEDGTSPTIHIVLIEAKLDTRWTNEQMEKKVDRLKAIFDKGPGGVDVVPHFVMMSPKDPSKKKKPINTANWPEWMRNGNNPKHWLELPLSDGLRKVTRCNADGKSDKGGGHLSVSGYEGGRWRALTRR